MEERIKNNEKKIEELKNNLTVLKEEKNKKQNDIMNLLSNKESIEEIYKNQVYLLNNSYELLIILDMDSFIFSSFFLKISSNIFTTCSIYFFWSLSFISFKGILKLSSSEFKISLSTMVIL